jgi:F-type H+-transporting ATPase subunit delta
MTLRGVARRYAGALFDVLHRGGTGMDRARADLDAMAQLVAGHAELRRLFVSPAVAPQKKRAVLEAILGAGGDVMPEIRRLLFVMADRDRLGLIGDVAGAFGERVNAAARVMPAEVTTAVPLPEGSRAALAAALGRATGNQITLTERVDPAIVGGVVARVGSLVFDGSVTRQIERLRQKLLAEA